MSAGLSLDEATLAREREALFRGTWQLVGFAGDLARPGDWIASSVGGRSVVVQNFDGEVRAFHNVCVHRGARIRCEPRGNGPLRCGYHGWTYDARGVPIDIPKRAMFARLPASLALAPWEVARPGPLVFVRQSGGPAIDEALGEAGSLVRELGGSAASHEVTVTADWKLVVEDSLEGGMLVFPSLVIRRAGTGAVLVHARPLTADTTLVALHGIGALPPELESRERLERLHAGLREGGQPAPATERILALRRAWAEKLESAPGTRS